MAMEWIDRVPQRPDRYFDWERLNSGRRGGPGDGRWCSVLLQVFLGPQNAPAANLVRLSDEVEAQSRAASPQMRMDPDERAALGDRIRDVASGRYIPDGDEDAALSFFVYLPEARAYREGGFADTPYYRIRLVGRPIEGLGLNDVPTGDPVQRLVSAKLLGPPSRCVAIGVIDDSIAFAHRRFRTRRGVVDGEVEQTRIAHLWLQDVAHEDRDPGYDIVFGRKLTRREIDEMMAQSAGATGIVNETEVYRQAGSLSFEWEGYQGVGRRVSHGTHVMDLACGYDPEDAAGDDRPILAVQLPDAATADTSGLTMASYFLQGLRQIMLWADKLDDGKPVPLVVNFSYGMLAGPKDGSHALEVEIDRLVAHRNKTVRTAVVLPASNAFRGRTNARMRLAAWASEAIDWVMLPDDATPSFLEIWLEAPGWTGPGSPIDVKIAPPSGPPGPASMPANGQAKLLVTDGHPILGMYRDEGLGATGKRTRIFAAVNPTKLRDRSQAVSPSGAWRVTVTNMTQSVVTVDLCVQRDDTPAGYRRKGRQSYLDHPAAHARDPETGAYDALGPPGMPGPVVHEGTLSAIANGQHTIVVAAADAGPPPKPAPYSPSGPTLSRNGPDFAAVVEEGPVFAGARAAGTFSGVVVAMSGTSAAAPQVARGLADAGGDLERLKQQLGAGGIQDGRLGFAVLPLQARDDLPPRRR